MIENLFSSKILFKILNILFRNENKNLNTSEIIKAAGKNQANVHRELEKLVAEKIIIKEKNVGNNFFQVNKNYSYFNPLKELFSLKESFSRKYFLLNEEGGACLLSLNYFFRGFSGDYAVQRGLIKKPTNIISHFNNNYAKFYFEKGVFEENVNYCFKKLLSSSPFVSKIIYPETIALGESALDIFRGLRKNNFRLSQEEGVNIINQADDIITKQIGLNSIATFDFKDQIFSNYLKNYLFKKDKDKKFKINFLLEKLLAPVNLTFTQLLRQELLVLAIARKEGQKDYNTKLDRIWEDWKWLNYGYRGPVLAREYFQNILDELTSKPLAELRKEIKELKNNAKLVKQEKEKIYNSLGIDKKHQNFIESLSLLSCLKIYRKDTAFLLIYLTHEVLNKFNKGLKMDNLLYLTLEEAKEMIRGKLVVDKKELVERERNCVQLAKEEVVLTGDEAKIILEQSVEEDTFEKRGQGLKLLEGMTACLGKTGDWIYGKAKIVNTKEEIGKMEEGDILISVATTPDILPAMKKAAAIITDHGGITCHAAIVSRELNIPCLIATKYATKVFQDGDRIIVCPRHGYVKFQ